MIVGLYTWKKPYRKSPRKKALANISSTSWLNCRSENHQLRVLTVVAWKEALAKITSKEGPREKQQLRGLTAVAWKEALAKITSKEGPRKNHQLRGLTVVLRGLTVVACKEALLKITLKEGPRENQQLCGLTVVGWKEALAKINSNESPRENQQHFNVVCMFVSLSVPPQISLGALCLMLLVRRILSNT